MKSKASPKVKLQKKLSDVSTARGKSTATLDSKSSLSQDSDDFPVPRRRKRKKSFGSHIQTFIAKYWQWVLTVAGLALMALLGYYGYDAKIQISVIDTKLENHDKILTDHKEELKNIKNQIDVVSDRQQEDKTNIAVMKSKLEDKKK